MSIEECRSRIDKLDDEILELFQQRMTVAAEIAGLKKASHGAVLDRKREREILLKVFRSSSDNLGKYSVKLFSNLMELSRAYQRELNQEAGSMGEELAKIIADTPEKFPESAIVACMGREGAYGQIAADKLFDVANIMYVRNVYMFVYFLSRN